MGNSFQNKLFSCCLHDWRKPLNPIGGRDHVSNTVEILSIWFTKKGNKIIESQFGVVVKTPD